MANSFLTKTLQVTTELTDLVPVYTSGQVVVHAVFISNITTSDVRVDMGVYDGAGTRKSWILFQTIVPPESTLTIEKPINLESSATSTEQRKVMTKAASNSAIEIMASVLVIT